MPTKIKNRIKQNKEFTLKLAIGFFLFKITIKLLDNEFILETNRKLDSLQVTVDYLKNLLEKMITTDVKIDDWITEKEAMRISGLSRTTLLRLRKTGELTSSSIAGKHLYYKYSDFKKLLDRNEENR